MVSLMCSPVTIMPLVLIHFRVQNGNLSHRVWGWRESNPLRLKSHSLHTFSYTYI